MRTRSQTQKELSEKEFNFDFDESNRAWLENKIRLDNGCYNYRQTRSSTRATNSVFNAQKPTNVLSSYQIQTRSHSKLYC
jgi:hypothetical protein